MTRLDRHVASVRTRMALSVFLRALAWAGMVFALAVWAAIVIDKLVQVRLPRQAVWFWVGLGLTVASALAYTIWRRPTRRQAAVAIDERLNLKEKFSTALYVRPSKDPFAMATVRDAEATADKVSLQKRFPLEVPKALGGTAALVALVFLTAWLLPTFDLFGVQARRQAQAEQLQQQQSQARDAVRRAIAQIEAAPPAVADKPQIKLALQTLKDLRSKPSVSPEQVSRTAQKAVQDVQDAIKEKIRENRDYAITQQEMQDFKNIAPPADEHGPMADAQRALSQGKLGQAVSHLDDAVKNWDKLDKKEQQKAAEQAKNFANALQKMANDPKVQQNIQKQLQKMGANQQQAQQIRQMMQAAAAGDKQAQQQLANAAKQLAQQMNQKGNLSPQQQRQIAQQVQQQMRQMQQQTNTQVNAQQLAQLATGLQQAMAQSAQGGRPGQNQQANQGGQQGSKQGQKGSQQVANAARQMQQQMQQMQAVANDAAAVAAGQNGQDGQGNQPGQNPGANGNGQRWQGQAGQWGKGNNQQQGQAMGGGPGRAAGNNRPAPEVAPFQTKDELDPSQRDAKGKILASTFVKAGSIKGDAKMEMHKVLPSVEKDATDEVDEQRIPRQDASVVRDYFDSIRRDVDQK